MAAASLLALLDDIASVLDDVATMTQVAARKTAGVLGDDLALNAQQVAGVRAERELPVVRAVALGSLKNKAILVPAALLISAVLPWAVMPILMLGGLYLCLEGAEKLAQRGGHGAEAGTSGESAELTAAAPDPAAFEAEKIRGAIRTDFVLSAEIIVIALGTVAGQPFATQVAVLVGVGLLMTVGVYGFVAAIVKLDDLGLCLMRRGGALAGMIGRALLATAPRLLRALTVIGTAAMFMVGGSILTHGLPPLHHALDTLTQATGALAGPVALLLDMAVGLLAGALAHVAWALISRLRGRGSVSV